MSLVSPERPSPTPGKRRRSSLPSFISMGFRKKIALLTMKSSHLATSSATPATMPTIEVPITPPSSPPQPQRPSLYKRKLSSKSQLGDIPQTWPEYNDAYAGGQIDFDDPPLPPTLLRDSDYATPTGQYRAPPIANEQARQRCLNGLKILGPRSRNNSTDSTSKTSKTSLNTNDLNPGLQNVVEKAKMKFGARMCGVHVVDGEKEGAFVLFIAAVGGMDRMNGGPVSGLACGHTLLAASVGETDGLVVLDLEQDWRFNHGSVDVGVRGFYAGYPIMVAPAFGDASEVDIPVGVMCVVDPEPRTYFSPEERRALATLAKEAGDEIARYSARLRLQQEEVFAVKHDQWSMASMNSNLPTMKTPTDSINSSSSHGSVVSLPTSAASTSSSSRDSGVATTCIPPIFACRNTARVGVSAASPPNLSDKLRSILNLATSLLAESLDFDFVYLASLDLGASSPTSIQFLSTHNTPIPRPLFDVGLHLQPLQSSQSTLLFTNPNTMDLSDGAYSTGLLVRVGVSGSKGFVLGGFSEGQRKVLTKQDFLFFKSFAADLARSLEGYSSDVGI